MERKVVEWTVSDIYKKREQIIPADFQREPKLWNLKDKQLLIDSILHYIDIPKLYFYEADKNRYEIIDGQQRLWALWEFLDNKYKYNNKKFNELDKDDKDKILTYPLQITLLRDVTDEYLRKLFLRLQLGLLLVAGEKLHASVGLMRDFIFKKMVKHPFMQSINIPSRRYAKETLCAQICINSFSKTIINDFSRTRYEDLDYFFETFKTISGNELKIFDAKCKHILSVLDVLHDNFGEKTNELRNRSFILSVYLFVEELIGKQKNEIKEIMSDFVKFSIDLLRRLKAEAKLGFQRKNEALYIFESYLSNAPGEKYQIAGRHTKLKEFFSHYQKTGKIMGDK
ncbi:MAG: DUF262 domain-containing protein [Thermodesulfovibrionia bacterium]|nr:DUF262 domain-containing protein [Thermodesulfovibrionia bacterium]